jgi:hypothetical protein
MAEIRAETSTDEPAKAAPAARMEPPTYPKEAYGDAPFELSLYFPHVMVAGHPSIIHYRLVNTGKDALESATLAIETHGFATAATKRLGRIAPGISKSQPLEVEPVRSGHFLLQVAVSLEIAGQRYRYCGSISQRILEVPDGQNISININDIQSSTGGGANANLGAEYGNVSFSNLLGGANIRNINDLLELEYPENYQPVSMGLDYELSMRAISGDEESRRRALSIPPAHLAGIEPGSLCVLSSTSGEAHEIRLVHRSQLRLGRSRSDADYVTWFWPRSSHNDERTRRISKLHAVLEAGQNGLTVCDAGTTNGTRLDRVKVGDSTNPAVFQGRSVLCLGEEYGMELEHLSSVQPEGPCIENERRWMGPAREKSPYSGAVQVTPREGEEPPYSAVWLFTDCAFGTSRSNAVVLGDTALDEIQGRFHYYRGCFWLENAVANGAVTVNGRALPAGSIVPLTTGMTLVLGNTQLRVGIGA